jgi:hypothetical protein
MLSFIDRRVTRAQGEIKGRYLPLTEDDHQHVQAHIVIPAFDSDNDILSELKPSCPRLHETVAFV